jgi:hypothetical protein
LSAGFVVDVSGLFAFVGSAGASGFPAGRGF